MIGNTNLTLYNYNDNRNNSQNYMIYVDEDTDGSTQNSSSATLQFSTENDALPGCSNVIYAGLYWTGRMYYGSNLSSTERLAMRTVKFKAPGGSYQTLQANDDEIRYPGDNDMYAGYIEVTDIVKNAGEGEYWLADMALSQGNGGSTGYYGGWGLVVVYENSKMKWRDITVFDGYAYVQGSTANHTLEVSGFNTVQAGPNEEMVPVDIKMGFMAGEGDVGISGDYFEIQKQVDNSYMRLSHTGNTTENFFNSSIETGGNLRNPNLPNNTGLDISMFNVVNTDNEVIANSQTSTKFRYGSTQDTYVIFSIVFAVDAYIPETEAIVTNTAINGVPNPVSLFTDPGHILDIEVELKNKGTEATDNTLIVIPIPYTASFVENSISSTIYPPLNSSNAAPVFDPNLGATGSIVWDIGNFPLPSDPDHLLASISFQLKATEDCSILINPNCTPRIAITGTTSGVGATTGTPFEHGFIQGHETSGNCVGEPIPSPLYIDFDDAAVGEHCTGDPDDYNREFYYCNRDGLPVQVAEVEAHFPPGSRFYNEYPINDQSTEFTADDPFPATIGTATYYAIPPGITNCFFVFDIIIDDVRSTPTVNDVDYCLNDAAVALTATPSNPSYNLYYYTDNNPSTTAQTSIIPSTANAGQTTYYIAEGLSNACISPNRAPIVVSVIAPPSCEITGSSSVCPSSTNNIYSAPAGMDSYSWSITSGTATLNGASDEQTVEVIAGSCNEDFTLELTVTNSNECSSTCSLDVKVEDDVDPTWTVEPSDMTSVACDPATNATAFANWLASFSGTDECGTATVTHNSPGLSDGCGATGTETVTFTLTDECGNDITKDATFTIIDDTDPTIDNSEKEDLTVECADDWSADLQAWLNNAAGATASDLCGDVEWSNNYDANNLSDLCGATGAVTVTFTATDECQNTATTTAVFTIEDTTDPTIDNTNLSNIEIECGIDQVNKLSDWLANNAGATATDNCSGVTWSNNYGEEDDVDCDNGAITVIFTATDACGNESTTSASYSIQDNTAPEFVEELPADVTVECDAIPAAAVLTATDNCGEATVAMMETSTEPETCDNYTITRVWTATDECGNETVHTQVITVKDETKPVFVEELPADVTVECDAIPAAAVLTATDNCGEATVAMMETSTEPETCDNYTITRVWTATDECGNETVHTQVITVKDETAPEVSCNDITVQLDANGVATITVDDINGGATDNCGTIDTMFISQETFNCDNVGENQVTLTAIDECGNEATCTATVTVEEGDADCGFDPFKANDDILTLIYCPGETVSGELDLFANDEGFTRENVSFTILTDLPNGVSATDGNLIYVNEEPTEAVITFTYSVCHTVNTENCDTAEVTIVVLLDTDCDGVPNNDDIDDDDDGILDIIEEENALDQTSLDSDGDGIVDRLDIDSDNDGIVDNIEWQSTIAEDGEYDYILPLGIDSNGDGWDDAYDPTSNGITYEPWDMDLDGTPDYLDTDTDSEGEDDNVEGWDEFPNDSIADVSFIGSDADGDGLDDAYDTYNTTTEGWTRGQNAIGSNAYLQDTDADGVRDWRDAVDDRTPPEQFACGEPVIPNAFSPNQDGYNDYFKIMIYCTGDQGGSDERVLGDDFNDARIEIFNRWGNLVYEQERYGNESYWGDVDAWWDGSSMHDMQLGDNQLPTATYYYILYFNDGSREPITGFVFLNN
ncbi:hypothetical protein FH5T_14305 [Draconibacterium orientale]|uniref:HYR domain-containing protein n=1 Tax=Draconibacterium orientale TaxID=1168034 RepID=A0ABM5QEQ8_9BACT|nr:hypothetical protein FH5T_14305 [Draconibacterium orientale]